MERPLPAYRGDEPYVFVSYAHGDSDIVFPEINRLMSQGFPIWWDEGISPGERWSEELGDRIMASSLFLFFVTPRAANSQNCMDEVYYALDRGKTILAVHLEETELPVGLDFRLSSRQAILKSAWSEQEYEQKLQRSVADHLGREFVPVETQARLPSRFGSRTALWSGGAALMLAVVLGSTLVYRSERQDEVSDAAQPEMTADAVVVQPAPTSVAESKPAIAVLPFDNLSGDPEQEYFSDGITEDIISRLATSSMLLVISRNSTFTYKGKAVKIPEVGRELGAKYVLEGSVRKAGDRIRITGQLIEAATDKHIWSRTYDRVLDDIFTVQDEISQQIVAELGVEYQHSEVDRARRVPTEKLTAIEAYWRGLEHHRRMTRDDNLQARRFFERAIEIDPNFADAYAMSGDTYARATAFSWDVSSESLDLGFDYAQTALRLDDTLAMGHQVLASVFGGRYEYEQSLVEAKKALALDPNNPATYETIASAYRNSGHPQQALEMIDKAMLLNPKQGDDYSLTKAWVYYDLGRYRDSIALSEEALSSNPDADFAAFSIAYNAWLSWVTQQTDDPSALDDALAWANRAVALDNHSMYAYDALSMAHLWRREFDQAVEAAQNQIELAPENGLGYWNIALTYCATGRAAEALELMRRVRRLIDEGESPSVELEWSYLDLGRSLRLSGGSKEEAVEILKKVPASNSTYHVAFNTRIEMVILYSELGRETEARAAAAELLQLAPWFSVEKWGKRIPFNDPTRAESDMQALRRAGLK